jgi:hypothetical protein
MPVRTNLEDRLVKFAVINVQLAEGLQKALQELILHISLSEAVPHLHCIMAKRNLQNQGATLFIK